MKSGLKIALVLICIVGLTGCMDTAETPSDNEIINESKATIDDVKSYSYEGRVLINETTTNSSNGSGFMNSGEFARIKTSYNASTDNRYWFVNISGNETSAGSQGSFSTMSYMVGNTIYTKIGAPPGKGTKWIKKNLSKTNASKAGKSKLEGLKDIYEISDIHIGEESLNGTDVYRIALDPDMERFPQVFENQTGVLQEFATASPEFKDARYIYWVDDDAYLPVRLKVSVSFSFTHPVRQNGGTTQAKTSINGSEILDFTEVNAPTKIELPEAARNATPLNDVSVEERPSAGATIIQENGTVNVTASSMDKADRITVKTEGTCTVEGSPEIESVGGSVTVVNCSDGDVVKLMATYQNQTNPVQTYTYKNTTE
ncbi:MAG: hypothetical protein ABEK59_04165 [Halobacteria archaeon]